MLLTFGVKIGHYFDVNDQIFCYEFLELNTNTLKYEEKKQQQNRRRSPKFFPAISR